MDGAMTEKSDDEKIVDEAKKRFSFCEDWESHARNLYVEDFKFGHADSDNMAQWPDQLLTSREIDQKPSLTVNKTRIHCLQIINDAKQNKAGIVVHPTTTDATYEAAEVYEDVVRHIEYNSKAQQAYDKAVYNMVFGGIGYCRVVTQYATYTMSPDELDRYELTDDQEILIKGIPDPLTVYMDPDAKEPDKSDSEYAFVFDDMSKDKFKREYPGEDDAITPAPLGLYDSWLGEDHVRVAEYWRRKHAKVRVVSVLDPQTGQRRTTKKENVNPDLIKAIRKDEAWDYRERDVDVITVQCFKIAGSKIVDRYEWAGQYIPIVPAIAEEIVIDGQMDRKGHVRYLKDPQRMYNYNTSAEVEFGALQTKTPYVGPAKAFEGYEEYYQAANVQNLGFLPYNHSDDEGNPIPPPRREVPPQMSPAFMKGMDVAQQEMMMASGQYQSQFGQNENATSGKAINERQRQGDNATYHFVDGAAIMVRQLGRIVVDLIPKIYDTPRILRIRGEDGTMKTIAFDPNSPDAVVAKKERDQVALVFNPNIGKYGVEADVGPSFATRRQEAWNAIVQLLTQSPQLIPIVGDLLFQNGDFPGADEIAQRLRRMVPPQALGEEQNPQLAETHKQMDQLMGMIEKLNVQLADKTADTNIKAFDALTKRLQAIGNAGPIVTPEQAQPLIAQAESVMLSDGVPQTFGEQPQQVPQPMPEQPQMAPQLPAPAGMMPQ